MEVKEVSRFIEQEASTSVMRPNPSSLKQCNSEEKRISELILSVPLNAPITSRNHSTQEFNGDRATKTYEDNQ